MSQRPANGTGRRKQQKPTHAKPPGNRTAENRHPEQVEDDVHGATMQQAVSDEGPEAGEKIKRRQAAEIGIFYRPECKKFDDQIVQVCRKDHHTQNVDRNQDTAKPDDDPGQIEHGRTGRPLGRLFLLGFFAPGAFFINAVNVHGPLPFLSFF